MTPNLVAILVPFRAQLSLERGQRQGNLWGMLAWGICAPPVLALIALPYIFWKPGLLITLPLALLFSIGFYGLSFQPLGRLLQQRAHAILQAVLAEA